MGLFSALLGGGQGPTTTTNTQYNNQGTNYQNTSRTQTGNTTTNTQNLQQFQNNTTPNIPGWYSSFLASLPQQYASLQGVLSQNATKPLIGAPQIANYDQAVNAQTNAQRQQLQSQLAAQGALNSGRATQMNTALDTGATGLIQGYASQVPLQNAAYQQTQLDQLMKLIGQGQSFTSPIAAFGTTQAGTGAQQGVSSTDTIQQLLEQILGGFQNSGNSTTSTSSKQNSGALWGGVIDSLTGI